MIDRAGFQGFAPAQCGQACLTVRHTPKILGAGCACDSSFRPLKRAVIINGLLRSGKPDRTDLRQAVKNLRISKRKNIMNDRNQIDLCIRNRSGRYRSSAPRGAGSDIAAAVCFPS